MLKEPKQTSIIPVSQVRKGRAILSSKLYLCPVAGPAFLEFHLEVISKDWVPGFLIYKPNPLAALHWDVSSKLVPCEGGCSKCKTPKTCSERNRPGSEGRNIHAWRSLDKGMHSLSDSSKQDLSAADISSNFMLTSQGGLQRKEWDIDLRKWERGKRILG